MPAFTLNTGFLRCARSTHSLAAAAHAYIGVFGLGNKPLVFVESVLVNCSPDEFAREIAVAAGAETAEVAVVDLCGDVCTHALNTHFNSSATRQPSLESGRIVIAANHAIEAGFIPHQPQARAERHYIRV